jgi:hypothetical protein
MTETAVCPVCLHEVLIARRLDGVPVVRGHRNPEDQYRRECGGSCREVEPGRVLVASWCEGAPR